MTGEMTRPNDVTPIRPTPDQAAALDAIEGFLRDDGLDAFILRGGAGTGKTALIAALVGRLSARNLSPALVAPTGRAARILTHKVGRMAGGEAATAVTIHRAIYALDRIEVNEEAVSETDPGLRMIFPLRGEEAVAPLIVVDEASMVGDREMQGDLLRFGSGRLLADLIAFCRMRRPGRAGDRLAKLLFVGDPAQLPPVGEETSPALDAGYLAATFGLEVAGFDLATVLRQAEGSAILDRATRIREALAAGRFDTLSLRPDATEIVEVDAAGAVGLIVDGIRARDQVVAVVASNATALDYNRSVRERLWEDAALPVQPGDTLLVNRNSRRHGLSNGDVVKVLSVDQLAETVPVPLAGGHLVTLRFRHAVVAHREGDGTVVRTRCLLLENLLDQPGRDLTPLEQRALLVHFRTRRPELSPKSAAFRQAIVEDPYVNALQVKYGYAMTCHKAQGGEWQTVLVHFAPGRGQRNPAFFRWAYTAVTRAVGRLILVNPPDFSPADIWAPDPVPAATADNPGEDPRADPDWHRLSFPAAAAPLMQVHRRLRALWAARGITIEDLRHLQYCERYTLAREGRRAMVQYHYNGKFQPGRAGMAPGGGDAALAEEALAAFQGSADGAAEAEQPAFIRDFLVELDAALAGTSIRRTGQTPMPYRLRIGLADRTRTGEVDVIHDARQNWTAVQEVGGPGATGGLCDELRRLMTDRIGRGG